MTRTGRRNTRRPSRRATLLVAALVAVVGAPVAAAALPSGVVMLKGPTSQNVEALFTYRVSAHTLNGYSISYTCRGRKPVNDSDVYTITDGGNDSRRLTTVKPNGDVTLSSKGDISRFTEDGQRPRGTGRLILKAKLTTKGHLRILKGSARVTNATCPSKALTFRSTVKR
jgi:hypothetical protein